MVTKLRWVKRYRSFGKEYAYYRRDGQRVPIEGEPDSVEWLESYNRIHASFEKPNHDNTGTLGALIKAYKASPEFAQLAPRTRSDYDGLMSILDDGYGAGRVGTLQRHHAYSIRDKFAGTPRKANHLVATLRLLMNFAVKRGWRTDNPLLNWDRQCDLIVGWAEMPLSRASCCCSSISR